VDFVRLLPLTLPPMCPRVLHRTPSRERLTCGTDQVGDDPDAGDAGRPPLGPLRRGDPPPPPVTLGQLEIKKILRYS
jgi:hypothetical protein